MHKIFLSHFFHVNLEYSLDYVSCLWKLNNIELGNYWDQLCRQLYSHLPRITKTIQVRRTRHADHCWRSRNELISDVLLWTPTHGYAKAGWAARTYILQLCEDTGCCPEDLPQAMNDREKWRERVRDIRATSTTWWWWWCQQMIFNLGFFKQVEFKDNCLIFFF